jgi:uncharacterized protein
VLCLTLPRPDDLTCHDRNEGPPVNRIASLLSRLVLGAPVFIVVAVIVLTGALGAVSGQAESATGNEGFAPDNPELLAAEEIGERFNGSGEIVLQILVEGDDVIGADGLAAAERVTDAVAASDASAYLS